MRRLTDKDREILRKANFDLLDVEYEDLTFMQRRAYGSKLLFNVRKKELAKEILDKHYKK